MNSPQRDLSSPPLDVSEAYDLAAPLYDAWKWQALWRAAELPFIRAVLEPQGPARLLDVGCGTGWYLQHLSPWCAEAVGVDLSQGMLAQARRRLPEAELVQADARDLPFGEGRFDLVLSTRVLSHIAGPEAALAEARRVLRPGGLVVVSDVDAAHPYAHTRLPVDQGHVLAHSYKHPRAQIEALFEAQGFASVGAALISPEGTVSAAAHLGMLAEAPIVGWISAWRG